MGERFRADQGVSTGSGVGTSARPFRVLTLDGGGMRGTYTATYLSHVADTFARKRSCSTLDVGAAFDLIVGTSTGGILACALAACVPLSSVVDLYRNHGPHIFRKRLPNGLISLISQKWTRPRALRRGTRSLQTALEEQFGNQTLGELYQSRRIALAITAVEMSQHRSWVFKTPHATGTCGRDDGYRLVDICLATSAAPIYRSMAAIKRPNSTVENVFVDGGLWANNPVLVGLIDALEMADPKQRIEIFSIGTCPLPAGEQLERIHVDRGLGGWKFGGLAAGLSIDAQEFAYDNIARKLCGYLSTLGRPCDVVRFPRNQVPAALMPFLELDDTRSKAIEALVRQAMTDAELTNSLCNDSQSREGRLICELFAAAPEAETPIAEAIEVDMNLEPDESNLQREKG